MTTSEDRMIESDPEFMDLPADMFRMGANVEASTVQMQHRQSARAPFRVINVDVKYTPLDDMGIFEGDIVLGDLKTLRNAVDSRGLGIVGKEFRWPNGIVPYVTQDAVKTRVEAAIAHWQEHTPIRFKLREDEADFISFEARSGCWSQVGRHGGEQVISLDRRCSIGSAIHEIGHALGLWHEQGRSDRDEFIEVIMENIEPNAQHNFDKHIQDGMDLGEYDYNSIMHYPAQAFGIGGNVTIRTKQGHAIGQRNGLSKGDIASIKLLYPELAWPEQEMNTDSEIER